MNKSRRVVKRGPVDNSLVRVGVVGSREFTRVGEMYEVLDDFVEHCLDGERMTIVSGGARGADTLAEEYSEDMDLTIIIHYPLWKLYGTRAGFVRNEEIVHESDVIIAFPNVAGSGTQLTITIAHAMGIPVIEFPFEVE